MVETRMKVAIVGTGLSGISTAYYLVNDHGIRDLVLIDSGQPMAFTSAQSGENYRNWWPHPAMVSYTNRSIDLMEDIALATGNRPNLTRRGYVLATREREIGALLDQLHNGLSGQASGLIRTHSGALFATYQVSTSGDWQAAPTGVDVLQNKILTRGGLSVIRPRH